MPGNQSTFPLSWEKCAPPILSSQLMPSTNLVPCFYTGQDYRRERPAAVHTRQETRKFKLQHLGKFIENGKIFLFFKQLAKKLWDGPLGVGNLLPFSKASNPLVAPDKLHYATPMAGDRTAFARHRRHRIHVSSRSRWSVQILPVGAIACVC